MRSYMSGVFKDLKLPLTCLGERTMKNKKTPEAVIKECCESVGWS